MRAAVRIALLAVLGMFVFAACDTGVNSGGNEDGDFIQAAAAPVISPATANHTDMVSITMTTTTPGATIRYPTNGSFPGTSSPAYQEGVPVVISGEGTYTVRAIALASGFLDSPVSSRTYTITASQPASHQCSLGVLRCFRRPSDDLCHLSWFRHPPWRGGGELLQDLLHSGRQ